MKIESIVIVGRMWFDRLAGKEVYSAEIVVNGELVKKLEPSDTYCQGDKHIVMANDWLSDNGFLDNPRKGPMNIRTPLWRLKDELGFCLLTSIDQVRHRKQL